MPDLVLACTAWADAVHRGGYASTDRLLAAAVGDPRLERVLVANPFRSAPVRAARRLVGQTEPPLPDGPGVRAQYTPVRLRRHDARRAGAVSRAHQRYGERLARRARHLGMSRPALITSNALTAAFADLDWAGTVTYFGYDDWTAHPAFARWREVYEVAYRRIRDRRLRVAAVSPAILERIDPRGPARCVPNGVDPAEWSSPDPPPSWLLRHPPPRALYVGVLDRRLDADAVADLAGSGVVGSIVLLGEVADHRHVASLRSLPNVHVAVPVGRRAVAAAVRAADVCLLPHRSTPLTTAMSPLKVYEYLAAGRPVAATDLPPVRALAPLVALAPPGVPFAAAVSAALARGPLPEADRQAFVAEHAWSRRVDDLFALAGVIEHAAAT